MSILFRKERIALLNQLVKNGEGLVSGLFLTLDPGSLRFRHGESLAELKVPYHLGGEDEEVVEKAVMALAALLKMRFDAAVVPVAASERRAIDIAGHFSADIKHPLREKSFRTDALLAGSAERLAADEIIFTTPAVDGGILVGWLGPDGAGKNFMLWFSQIIEKALKDEATGDLGEPTAYLALLAVMNCVRKKKDLLKDMRVKGLSYEKMDLLVGFSLYNALRSALNRLFGRLEEKRAAYYIVATEILLKTALEPRTFISIQSNLLSSSLNPYGIGKEVFDLLAERLHGVEGMKDSCEGAILRLTKEVKAEKELREAVFVQSGMMRMRELLADYLTRFDMPGMADHEALHDLYQDDRQIKAVITDSSAADKIAAALSGIKDQYAKDFKRSEAIEALRSFVSGFVKLKFRWFSKGPRKEIEDGTTAVLEGFLACLLDEYVEQYTASMRACMVDRRESHDPNALLDEYKRGRLYRFSVDDRPVIKTLEVGFEGQLFIDMKDFTRKTLKVKEIAMAEFMKEHFYAPIIDAAIRSGMGTSLDEGGIRLASLPGDAAIFSGSVGQLTGLAREIQKVLRDYREKLSHRLPKGGEEFILQEIHKKFEAKKEDLKKIKLGLGKAAARGAQAELGPGSDENAAKRLAQITEEEHALERRYMDELEAAITTRMEAGLFISYGTKAEVLTLDGTSRPAGGQQVSIGEKINEAARGTNRNSAVRTKLEILIEKERVGRKNEKLAYPFDVYIDKTYTVRIPPEFDSTIAALIARKKTADVKAITTWLAKEFFTDLASLAGGAPLSTLRILESSSDIYNKGQALSAEALTAYMRESKGAKFFFKKEVSVVELDKSIRDVFFFQEEKLEFWFDFALKSEGGGVEGFVKIGEVVFKGFESAKPTAVYEILNPEAEFFKALQACHVAKWLEEAKKKEGLSR